MAHLSAGGTENRIPHANQLWMLVGFRLFKRLAEIAPCVEVFPQATARVLGSGKIHKTQPGGVDAQISVAALEPLAGAQSVDLVELGPGVS